METGKFVTVGLILLLTFPLVKAEYTAPKLTLAKTYTYIPCEVTQLNFLVKNVGISKGEVRFLINGEASKWIKIPSSIILEPREERLVTGLISVPCNLTGEYNFTLTATTPIGVDSQDSMIIPVAKALYHFAFFPVAFGILVTLLIIFCFIRDFVIFKYRELPESFDDEQDP